MGRGRCAIVAAGFATVAMALGAAPAPAYKYEDIHPGSHLTYFIAHKTRVWDIREAAKMWNTSGAHVRLTETRSRRRANVIVLEGGKGGTAITGWNPGPNGGAAFPMYITLTTGTHRDHFNGAHIMAHEFGHVFGLDHTKACAVMNPTFKCQGDPNYGYWYCRGVQKDDVRGVGRLYGGRWHPKRAAKCLRRTSGAPGASKQPLPSDKPAPTGLGDIAAPSDLSVSVDGSGDGTNLAVTLRAPQVATVKAIAIYWRWGTCPVQSNPDTWEGADSLEHVTPGQDVRFDRDVPPPSGQRHLCVAAVAYGPGEAVSKQVTAAVDFP